MIAGIFHKGSGLGDQLFRYITVRTLAEHTNRKWGMLTSENFKGNFFVDFLMQGCDSNLNRIYLEKDTRNAQGNDIRSYDPEINFVKDNTVIDGSFEDFKYWGHNLHNIDKWLAVEPLEIPDDLCVIGFRGGEYALFPDLFLPKTYWESAIALKRAINPNMRFEVHTDDPELAKTFFPGISIVDNTQLSHSQHSNMGYNWRAMRYAKHAIIANSSFYILPRLLAHQEKDSHTIASRYWARHNQKIWARPATYYQQFQYIHAEDSDTAEPNMAQ